VETSRWTGGCWERLPRGIVHTQHSLILSIFSLSQGYDTEQFYENERHLSSGQISAWMSWVPAVFGSTGALLGGVIGDWLVREKGTRHRIGLLVCAQLLAAPCASACLLLEHPYSFLAYAVYLLVGETYIGTCYAVLMDLSAVRFHSFMTACYIFCMANLGGNASLLLPAVQNAVGGSMTTALQILWPGAVALSGVVYAGLWFWSGKARPEG
jgi:hypothetical protein